VDGAGFYIRFLLSSPLGSFFCFVFAVGPESAEAEVASMIMSNVGIFVCLVIFSYGDDLLGIW
jgi:hypothetical protein